MGVSEAGKSDKVGKGEKKRSKWALLTKQHSSGNVDHWRTMQDFLLLFVLYYDTNQVSVDVM